jgi:hypothetical protein
MSQELDDFLMHYGVKGMKWGVRKDDGLNRKERRKAKEEARKKLPKEVKKGVSNADLLFKTAKGRRYAASLKRQIEADAAEIAKNNTKFLAKGGFTDADVTPEQKRKKLTPQEIAWLAVAGTSLAVVAAAYAYDPIKNAVQKRIVANVKPGDKVSSGNYTELVHGSKSRTWRGKKAGGYFQPEALERKEFEIPAGTTFHRISRKPETTFRSETGTYATHSTEDFNRYVNSFRKELGSVELHHVQFKAKQPVRVSDYKTNSRAMAMAMEGRVSSQSPVTLEEGAKRFRAEAGGSWHRVGFSDPSKPTTVQSFFEILEHKGYGALVDEMDAGVIGETPLMVFANRLFDTKSSSELTPEMIAAAQRALIEINNRK